ncbi:MAG TPA: C-GCAxxG-C-C family protein [Polyangiaceae bacterium]
MNHSDKAVDLFMQGYNCAQATAAAFADDFGVETPLALRSMAGFGGGLGGLRETCGVVSAMAYVAGLHAGEYAPKDRVSKKVMYDLVKAMTRDFSERHGTISCRELLERAGCFPKADPSDRNKEYYATRPCARIVASAAEIISRTLDLSR